MSEYEEQPVEGYEGGYEDEPAYDGPDISDAIAQLHAHHQAQQQPEEYESDLEPYVDDEQDAPEQQALEEFVSERVAEELAPIQQAHDQEWREREVRGLAEQYPALRDPAVADAVAGEVEALAQALDNPQIVGHPYFIRQAFLAQQAEQVAGQQPEPPPASKHQAVETGTGPSAPTPSVDPVEQAYLKAFAGGDVDDYGFPKS
jgi:hypothetical protein